MNVRIDSYHSGVKSVDINDGTNLGAFLGVFGPPDLSSISVKVVSGSNVRVDATPGDLLKNSDVTLRPGDTIYFYPKKIGGAH